MKNAEMKKLSGSKTYLAIPGGEWFDSLMQAFDAAKVLTRQYSSRNYRIDFPQLDLIGVIARTNNIPDIVLNENSIAIAGFAGSDTLIRQGKRKLNETGKDWVVPLSQLVPTAPKPEVYLGTTPNHFAILPEGMSTSLDTILEGLHRNCIS